MSMALRPDNLMEGQAMPTVRQFSVFLENRIGQLLRLTQLLDPEDIRMIGLSVVDAQDCAVVRFLFDTPAQARDILIKGGFAVSTTEVLVVKLPSGKRGLLRVWQCLLACEINIAYCYPLLPASLGAAIVLAVDSVNMAAEALLRNKFELLGEDDLKLWL